MFKNKFIHSLFNSIPLLVLEILFTIPIILIILGLILIPIQIGIYLYSGSWKEMSYCILDNGCNSLSNWESWIGISNFIKFILSQHFLISGIILAAASGFLLLLIAAFIVFVLSFFRGIDNKA